ncbi:hypothetical protein EYF80_005027 [Liparis tanakae]|uniref:Uncharacterized protein n=1 Tax=Liparis tanakae TaxID=230148 RepID=A0A4Z2J554_9TELE|nr:hypothetical protein EYF80_005027 [Liparis tanakae]
MNVGRPAGSAPAGGERPMQALAEQLQWMTAGPVICSACADALCIWPPGGRGLGPSVLAYGLADGGAPPPDSPS